MFAEWQNWVVLAIVFTAAAYLGRRVWRSIAKKRAGGCGACASCPAESAKPLVKLEMLGKPRSDSAKT